MIMSPCWKLHSVFSRRGYKHNIGLSLLREVTEPLLPHMHAKARNSLLYAFPKLILQNQLMQCESFAVHKSLYKWLTGLADWPLPRVRSRLWYKNEPFDIALVRRHELFIFFSRILNLAVSSTQSTCLGWISSMFISFAEVVKQSRANNKLRSGIYNSRIVYKFDRK